MRIFQKHFEGHPDVTSSFFALTRPAIMDEKSRERVIMDGKGREKTIKDEVTSGEGHISVV